MNSSQGKKAVVIGGTHGMGRAIVDALLDAGAEVLLTGRSDATLRAVRDDVGQHVRVHRSDVSRLADIEALAAAVRSELGGIDHLFVNAGISELGGFEDVTEESYDRQFAVNTKGAFFTVQRLAPLLREGGSIVFTSSVAEEGGTPGMSVYSATKAALRSFASGFAAELLPRGIRVNTVSPGFIHTPTGGIAGLSGEERAQFEKLGDEITPMGRHGSAQEVARAALFLATEATFTTGTTLAVDGGLGQKVTAPM